jgi:hypothetical protein
MESARSPIREAELKLSGKLPALVDVAVQLAMEGDRALLMYCIDRVLGKPVQPVDITQHIAEIAADFGVPEARVTSIVERLRQRKTG